MPADLRLTLVPWAATVNLAVTSYIELLALELSKHRPVQLVDYSQPDQMRSALELMEQGRVANWVVVSNVGCLYKLCGEHQRAAVDALLAHGRTRYIFLDYDYPAAMTLAFLPRGSVYTHSTAGFLSSARRLIRADVVTGVLPHGALPATPAPWSERDLGLVFPGTLVNDPAAMRTKWRSFPTPVPDLLEAMLAHWEEIDERCDLLPDLLAERTAATLGLPLSLTQLVETAFHFDLYVRQRARFDLLDRLGDAPMTFIGAGWDAHPAPRRTFLGAMPQQQALALMQRAQLILNLTAPYYRSHERVFNAMAMEAAVGTYGRGFLANAGDPVGDAAVVYLTPETLGDTLCRLVERPEKLRDLAETGRRHIMAGHTWAHRALQLLHLIDEAETRFPL